MSPSTSAGLSNLIDMARESVKAGTIGEIETPAIFRQIARDHLGYHVPARAQADLLEPECFSGLGDLVVAEFEIRPGVRGITLTKAIHNNRRLILMGRVHRVTRRLLVKITRWLVRLVAHPIMIFHEPMASGRDRRTERSFAASGAASAVCACEAGGRAA